MYRALQWQKLTERSCLWDGSHLSFLLHSSSKMAWTADTDTSLLHFQLPSHVLQLLSFFSSHSTMCKLSTVTGQVSNYHHRIWPVWNLGFLWPHLLPQQQMMEKVQPHLHWLHHGSDLLLLQAHRLVKLEMSPPQVSYLSQMSLSTQPILVVYRLR